MLSILAKQIGAISLGTINLALVIWAVLRHRRRQSMPDGFFMLWLVSIAVATFQVGLGGWFVLIWGLIAPGRHLFYGLVVGGAALAQIALLPRFPLGQRYKGKPLVYAFWAFVIVGAAFRSWMSA